MLVSANADRLPPAPPKTHWPLHQSTDGPNLPATKLRRASRQTALSRVRANQAGDRFAVPLDDDFFAFCKKIDQARELRFGFVHAHSHTFNLVFFEVSRSRISRAAP